MLTDLMEDPPSGAIDKALMFNSVAAEMEANAAETGHPRIKRRMQVSAELARGHVCAALDEVVGGRGG